MSLPAGLDAAALEAALKRLPKFERLAGVQRLSAGASRETYRLSVVRGGEGETLALRRAADDNASAMGAGPGLAAEATLMTAARAAGAPGPQVLMNLSPEDGLGAGFVMEWVSGETLGAKITRGKAFETIRRALAHQCGAILARIHSVSSEAFPANLETLSPELLVRRTHAAYLDLATPQPMIDFTLRWLLAHLPRTRRHTLVHGDFRNGNLVVDPEKGVVAVLDWELAHIGDPLRDIGWLLTRSWRFGVPEKPVGGFGEAEDLFAGYASVSGEVVDRDAVRFWEVFGSFWWAVGTLSMAQTFRNGRDPSVERPAIGRRSSECQIDCVNLLIPGWVRKPQPAAAPLSSADLPTAGELLIAVRDHLLAGADAGGDDRSRFLSRVAANSIGIVLREQALGADAQAWERQALQGLLGASGAPRQELQALRERLCSAIRAGEIDVNLPELHAYLRDSVFAQVMIDQPTYPGAIEAADHP